MRKCLLLVPLFVTTGAFAQEGVIKYEGQQTIKFSAEFLLASMPDNLAPDSAMIEMVLANVPADGITSPMKWEARFDGQTVLGTMDMSEMMSGIAGQASAGMTPFSGGAMQMPALTTEVYADYDKKTIVSILPSFMAEPYVVTQEADSAFTTPEWELTNQDSTILGYHVLRAIGGLDQGSVDKLMGGMSDAGPDMEFESSELEAWYAPELPTPAGPMMIGGLPGAVLFLHGEIVAKGLSLIMEFSADTIETTLDRPVVPPEGEPIELDEYQKIMELRMEMMQQQIRGSQ